MERAAAAGRWWIAALATLAAGRWWIAALATLAAGRVLLLAAAFPFFHQVDEHQHVDSVHRWSRGDLAGAELPRLRDPVVGWALRFGSFEYLEADPPPPFLARPGARSATDGSEAPWVPRVRAAHEQVVNQELDGPPVYYAVAAAWYRLGELALDDLDLLVWLRGLNALVLALLVVGSHRFLRRRAPDDPLLHWGVPALLAFIPQDAFYGVSPDGFCALVGALAFVTAVDLADGAPRPWRRDVGAGLAASAAFLTKYTNLVYLGLLAVALGLRALAGEPGRRLATRAALVAGAAALPVAAWLARNQLVLGDALGTARKVAHLEWQLLPWSALPEQPIFGPASLWAWASETLALFWRGELRWHGEAMTLPGLDAALALASLALLAAGAVSAWRALRRRAWLEPLALLATGVGFATLAVLSARFEFADWGNPTRARPWFTEGRLVLGVLLPFAIVFVRGLALLCGRLPAAAAWTALAAWIAFVTITDFALAAPAFASPWSWLNH